jgi:hypothetical protein
MIAFIFTWFALVCFAQAIAPIGDGAYHNQMEDEF